ncbi:matrix Gla protein [Hemibagrus wyckioides]|nr:matrix Gla protein [Hemibagrus wyckioides]
MRSFLRFVTLCVILVVAVCYDSEESNESYEDMFFNGLRANTFMNVPGRNNRKSYQSGRKFQAELRSEICENYFHCRLLARYHGSQAAYQKYFGSRPVNNKNNNYYNGRHY